MSGAFKSNKDTAIIQTSMSYYPDLVNANGCSEEYFWDNRSWVMAGLWGGYKEPMIKFCDLIDDTLQNKIIKKFMYNDVFYNVFDVGTVACAGHKMAAAVYVDIEFLVFDLVNQLYICHRFRDLVRDHSRLHCTIVGVEIFILLTQTLFQKKKNMVVRLVRKIF